MKNLISSIFLFFYSTSSFFAQTFSAGFNHSHVVCSDGHVVSWGANNFGQIGNDNDGFLHNLPVDVLNLGSIVAVSSGYDHSRALDENGQVYVWGNNNHGMMGVGGFTSSPIPIPISTLPGIKLLNGGPIHSMALDSLNNLWGWGDNFYGQLGNGEAGGLSNEPILILEDTDIKSISCSIGAFFYGFTLFLMNDSTVYGCGYNDDGGLGNGTYEADSVLTLIEGLTDVVQISAGQNHAMALKADGTVWAWGSNASGELGQSILNLENSNVPIQIEGLSDIEQVSAGIFSSMALKSDGTVLSWGYNFNGQLGIGSEFDSYEPAQVNSLSGIQELSSGNLFTLAKKENGDLWSWGTNFNGQLGQGEFSQSVLSPQIVQDLCQILVITTDIAAPPSLSSLDVLFAYPNPTRDIVNVNFPEEIFKGSIQVNVYDYSGQFISRQFESEKSFQVDLVGVPGLYFIETINKNGFRTINRVVKE